MEIILFILLFAILIGIFYLIFKLSKKETKEDDSSMLYLQNQINSISQQTNEKLDRTLKELNDGLRLQNQTLNNQLAQSNTSIVDQFKISQNSLFQYSQDLKKITEELTKVGKTNEQIQNFAQQLQSLEKILKNPKQRGVLGEFFLENIIENVLPPELYQFQYKFSNGEIVDAIIILKDKIVPIDSKFTLEKYNKLIDVEDERARELLEREFKNDLKERIDETAKYIRTSEGTLDFAFMFIPSEGVYYDLLINKVGTLKVDAMNLIEYAFNSKKVIIVSPTSLLAYIQTVQMGLRSLQIEESAQEILNNVKNLQSHLDAFEDNFSKLGKQMGTTVNTYNTSFKNLKMIDKDLYKLTTKNLEITSEEIEKPNSIIEIQ